MLTGATGFVGNHLIESIAARDWQMRALVRPTSRTDRLEQLGANLVIGDLRDREALTRAVDGVDTVFHLAAVTGLRGDLDFAGANEVGTKNLVDAVGTAASRPRRVVYLSSYAACGPIVDGRPRAMANPPRPLTAYGRTKLAGEDAVRTLENAGVEVVIIRAPAVYGPGDHAFLPYFRLVDHHLAPAPTGSSRRIHLLYVQDLVGALTRAAEGQTGTFPVAGYEEHTWAEITAAIATSLGKRPITVPLPAQLVRLTARAAEGFGRLSGRHVVLNREKAEEMLADGWLCDLTNSGELLPPESATNLEDGIANTVHWYRGQGWL